LEKLKETWSASKRKLGEEEMEASRIWWKLEFWRKSQSLWRKLKKIKENEKGKEIKKEDIFLVSKSETVKKDCFPSLSRGCGKHSEKYRNRPEIKYFVTTRKNYQKSRIIF